jgi:hypothetical protein
MLCVVAPFVHNQLLPAPAVSITESPAQKLTAPVMDTTVEGAASTITGTGADVAEHPFKSVTVTL